MAQIPDEIQSQISKGRRTKRQRFDLPSSADHSDHCSSSSAGVLTEELLEDREDQDLANCLILLAQGKTDNSLFLYQCKTCDRCFNSFQALGGHRASHKKPRIIQQQEQHNSIHLSLQLSTTTPPPPPPSTAVKSPKVHECSVCQAEFSSGQALGGHMRRHRALTATTKTTTPPQLKELMIQKERRNVLGLDLNLPAPEDDRHHRPTVAVFSAASPALVDCHY